MGADSRYWYVSRVGFWAIETWRGERNADNVYTVGVVVNLASAETIVNELNHLYRQAIRSEL